MGPRGVDQYEVSHHSRRRFRGPKIEEIEETEETDEPKPEPKPRTINTDALDDARGPQQAVLPLSVVAHVARREGQDVCDHWHHFAYFNCDLT